MCMFNDNVNDVSETKIFVAMSNNNLRQLVVYSNNVSTVNPTAMILPVPNISSIEFHECPENYFKIIDKNFKEVTRSLTLSLSYFDSLEVIKTGSYFVSIAKTLNDLDRINTSTFTLNLNETLKKVLSSYSESYGFLVCQINTGELNYKPLAYSHNRLKDFFIPTLHYHPDIGDDKFEPIENYAHDIYIANVDLSYNIPNMVYSRQFTRNIADDSKKIQNLLPTFSFQQPYFINFAKFSINGMYTNTDLIVPVL